VQPRQQAALVEGRAGRHKDANGLPAPRQAPSAAMTIPS
jgi:hypothetical protein